VLASYKEISMSDTNTPNEQTHPSKPKRALRPFRDAKPLPPDHWIYQRGPQFGFVHALPASLKAALDRKKAEEKPSP
jgi:hypothetical protein